MNAEAIRNQYREALNKRIEVCQMYLRDSGCATISLNNTVAVSSLWVLRGVIGAGDKQAIGPYNNGMPTLWSPRDAAALVKAFNAQLEAAGSNERVTAMPKRAWWEANLQDALRASAAMDEALAA